MFTLTALTDTNLDGIYDPSSNNSLLDITAGSSVTCSDEEYLKLERAGLITGTTLAGVYGTPACWSAVKL